MTDNPLKPPFTLPGVNILTMGPAGTGKTYAIGTLVDAGVDVFFLAIEGGYESLYGYWTDRGLPVPTNLRVHRLKPASATFADMADTAKKINMLTLDGLAKIQDPNKGKYNQFIALLEALNNFSDDRTGETYGPVDQWDQSRVLVVDGLTGINQCAMSLVIGGKPVRSQADWQIAQDQVERLTRNLTDNCRCHFILLAHVERETDLVLGGIKLMVSTLGRALSPKFPSMFSDVILTTRNGDKWTWDTASAMADLKTRNLELRSDLPQDFAPIFAKWLSRNKAGMIEQAREPAVAA